MNRVKKIIRRICVVLLFFAIGNITSSKMLSHFNRQFIFLRPQDNPTICIGPNDGTIGVTGILSDVEDDSVYIYNELERRYYFTKLMLMGRNNYYFYFGEQFFGGMQDYESYNELLWYEVFHAEQFNVPYAYVIAGMMFERMSQNFFKERNLNCLDTLAYIIYDMGALNGQKNCLEKMKEYKEKEFVLK